MKTHLNKITDRAKQIRRIHPKMKWTDAIKKASKELKGKTKAAPKKTVRRKSIYQTGSSNKSFDSARKAKPPGKRLSKSGKVYYEHRKNRSDMPGSLTGISQAKLIGEIKQRVEGTMGRAYVNLSNAKKAAEKKAYKKIISECKIKLRKLK